ncbi:MAG TPA: hypothetical protein VH741_03010, partial [Candidatus Limnocylindrales bacterium]
DVPAIALPAEPLDSLLALAARFDASVVVISEPRGDYPALLRTAAARGCFTERMPAGTPEGAAIFAIAEGCR